MTNSIPKADIWTEIADRAREAERRAVERQGEFVLWIMEWQKRTETLAYAMWEASGKPQGQAFDTWLASEQQVWGPLRERIQQTAYFIWERAGQEHGKALEDWVTAQRDILLPVFERTREIANSMWRASGEPLGRALDFWLPAEKQVLNSLSIDLHAGPHGPGGGPDDLK